MPEVAVDFIVDKVALHDQSIRSEVARVVEAKGHGLPVDLGHILALVLVSGTYTHLVTEMDQVGLEDLHGGLKEVSMSLGLNIAPELSLWRVWLNRPALQPKRQERERERALEAQPRRKGSKVGRPAFPAL